MHEKPAAPALRLISDCDENVGEFCGERPIYQPTMHIDDIFRELIRAEIRHGRLSTWRRRRIVQYAAQLKLSAVEAGRMIEECRDELLTDDDPVAAEHAFVLVTEPGKSYSFLWNIAFILAGLAMIIVAVARV